MENDFSNQIFKLDRQEISAIQDDIRLREKGYTFFYAVDTYDFVNFFTPYLNKLNFSEQRLNILAQEAICYESFFTANNNSSIVLMEEYKKELFQVKDLFIEKVKRAAELVENKGELVNEILALIDGGGSLLAVIEKNYELFLLSLIFTKRKNNINGISFLEFLKKKMHIDFFETDSPEFNDYATGIFKDDAERPLADLIYDEFIDRSASRLSDLHVEKLERYLDNTYHDLLAVERLFYANEKTFQSTDFTKNIFYYFSSTRYKSPLIFDIIDRKHRRDFPFHNIFPHSTTSILRNNFQVFLLNALVKKYPNSPEKAIDILEKLKEIKLYQQEAGEREYIPDGLNELLENYKAVIENHFYNTLLSNYKETLRTIVGAKIKNSKELKIMMEFNEYLEEKKKEGNVHDLAYEVSKLGQIALLKSVVEGRIKQVSAIKVKFGKDIIRFNFHHLPYLPFLFEPEMHHHYLAFYQFLLSISNVYEEGDSYDKTHLNYLGQLESRASNNIKQRSFEFLILTYIDLLTPAVAAEKNELPREIEQKLIQALEKRLRVAEKAERIRFGRRKQRNPAKKVYTSLFKEISYILVWLYRRNHSFHKIGLLETKWKWLGLYDPRFEHGIGLASIAEYYDPNSKHASPTYLVQKSVSHLSTALSYYRTAYEEKNHKVIKELLQRNIIAIYNSICDANILLYERENKKIYIERARVYLSEMKEYTDGLESPNGLPIPDMTEAELEACEAQIAYEMGQIVIAKKKMGYAESRYEDAMANKSNMNPLFGKKVREMLDQLTAELR